MTLSLFDETRSEASPANYRFRGPEYRDADDRARLTGQCLRIRDFMLDGRWRSLAEISAALGDPAASVSAQLRHLRRPRFGSYIVERQARGDRKHGLFEYRLLKPDVEDVAVPSKRSLREEVAELRQENAELRMRLAELEGAR
jgi:hypothetical protein